MHKKRLAAVIRPDPLGDLKRFPRPTSRIGGGMDNYNLSPQFYAHCGEGGGGWICVEWAEMNEMGYLKTRHRK